MLTTNTLPAFSSGRPSLSRATAAYDYDDDAITWAPKSTPVTSIFDGAPDVAPVAPVDRPPTKLQAQKDFSANRYQMIVDSVANILEAQQ